MKIAIVGAGAIGSLFSAYLSKSKEEIWLLDNNKERAAKLNASGITVEETSSSWQAKIKATASPQDIGKTDLIVLCVKSFHTKQVLEQIATLLKTETKILSLQNGVGNLEMISSIGEFSVEIEESDLNLLHPIRKIK